MSCTAVLRSIYSGEYRDRGCFVVRNDEVSTSFYCTACFMWSVQTEWRSFPVFYTPEYILDMLDVGLLISAGQFVRVVVRYYLVGFWLVRSKIPRYLIFHGVFVFHHMITCRSLALRAYSYTHIVFSFFAVIFTRYLAFGRFWYSQRCWGKRPP